MKEIVKNLGEMKIIASDFISNLKPNKSRATVIGLYGDLGSGKTTFTQLVAEAIGISEKVASPTFVIEKIYELSNQNFSHLIHIDAYRIEKSEEILKLGWQQIVSDPKNLILIEWPQRISDIMPEHINVNLSHISESDSPAEEAGRQIEIVI